MSHLFRVFLICIALSFPTHSFGANAFGVVNKWGLFHDGKGADFACWVANKAATRSGPRRILSLTVTKFVDKAPEVAVFSQKKYHKAKHVSLWIDGHEFRLITRDNVAFAKTKSEDIKIIKALIDFEKKGGDAVLVQWDSDVKTKFRLKGFNQAYQRSVVNCPTDR
jgi:hypothetical protein